MSFKWSKKNTISADEVLVTTQKMWFFVVTCFGWQNLLKDIKDMIIHKSFVTYGYKMKKHCTCFTEFIIRSWFAFQSTRTTDKKSTVSNIFWTQVSLCRTSLRQRKVAHETEKMSWIPVILPAATGFSRLPWGPDETAATGKNFNPIRKFLKDFDPQPWPAAQQIQRATHADQPIRSKSMSPFPSFKQMHILVISFQHDKLRFTAQDISYQVCLQLSLCNILIQIYFPPIDQHVQSKLNQEGIVNLGDNNPIFLILSWIIWPKETKIKMK